MKNLSKNQLCTEVVSQTNDKIKAESKIVANEMVTTKDILFSLKPLYTNTSSAPFLAIKLLLHIRPQTAKVLELLLQKRHRPPQLNRAAEFPSAALISQHIKRAILTLETKNGTIISLFLIGKSILTERFFVRKFFYEQMSVQRQL